MPAAVDQSAFPTLNPDRIPEHAQYEIAKSTFKSILRYFEQPGVQERFEVWKAERDQRQSKVENP
ncbi:MAG: hypothetical protein IJ074_01060 [Clostridia bacterium]|nr:hypothetical protein [Clostridia bacterium]